jgi:hypothetical protein
MLIRWHSSPVTGNPKHRMDNPNPREEEELVITDFVYAGKPWSDIADIADVANIANFVFAAGTGKHWSDIANILNTGTVNPIAGATATLSPTRGRSMPCG